MEVAIIGPNLRDQSKGQFHIHTAGCADIKKMERRDPEYKNGWMVEVDSRQDIVEHIYDDHMAEWERDHPGDEVDWREYDDIYLFPCVKNLPDLRPDDKDDTDPDSDEGEVEVESEEEDNTFAVLIRQAAEHGQMDGQTTAEDALSIEAILGYLEEHIDDDIYGTASSKDLDKVANAYATAFIKGFAERCRVVLNEFLETHPYDEADEA